MKRAIYAALMALLVVPLAQPTFVVPNFPDTTIKTKVSRGLQPPMVMTLRLKGPRQRLDSGRQTADPSAPLITRIWQCDRREWITLLDRMKTFRMFPIHETSENEDAHHLPPVPKPGAPVVTVTTDSQDSGERRQMGSYEARHIKSTVTVEPGEGAKTAASKMDVDGWYVDLPGLNCLNMTAGEQPPFTGWLVLIGVGGHDTLKYVKTGNATVGQVVEETSTVHSEGNVVVNKTELLEFSSQPLDESLFEIPANYTEAPKPGLHRPVP